MQQTQTALAARRRTPTAMDRLTICRARSDIFHQGRPIKEKNYEYPVNTFYDVPGYGNRVIIGYLRTT
ncbi:MAG TPA: hypothetical protein PKD54_05070, partial [Pirellulaceae bacterium]|nr:hypothetical protein [Pirellulaceae bacterium]